MTMETIVVQYVNQPKPGKKMGSIKTRDGRYFGCWPDKLALFNPGGEYVVETETTGDFTKIKGLANGNVPLTAVGQKGGAKYGATDDATAERIYCCGILNAAVSGGHLPVSTASLVAATNAARQAWAQTFGGKAASGHRDLEPPMPDDPGPF